MPHPLVYIASASLYLFCVLERGWKGAKSPPGYGKERETGGEQVLRAPGEGCAGRGLVCLHLSLAGVCVPSVSPCLLAAACTPVLRSLAALEMVPLVFAR